MSTINVLISSDCVNYGKAIKSMLSKALNTYRIIGVLNIEKVLEKAKDLQPELILFAEKNREIPISLISEIKSTCPRTILVLIVEHDDPGRITCLVKTGVDACLGPVPPGFLTRILELICRGDIMVLPYMMKNHIRRLANLSERLAPGITEELTGREREIFNCLLKKYSNKEISKMLYISESTVKTHVRSILSKIGAKNRFALLEGDYLQ